VKAERLTSWVRRLKGESLTTVAGVSTFRTHRWGKMPMPRGTGFQPVGRSMKSIAPEPLTTVRDFHGWPTVAARAHPGSTATLTTLEALVGFDPS
jgi:hypothetical protein